MEKIVLDCRIEKDFNFLNRKIVFKRVLINVDRKINIFKLINNFLWQIKSFRRKFLRCRTCIDLTIS